MSSSSGEDGELAQEDGSGKDSDGKPPKRGPGSGKDSDSGKDSSGSGSDGELAQKSGSGSDKPPKGDGSGSDKPPKVESSDSGSGSDGELAQKPGYSEHGSGPDLDSEDLPSDLEELEKELGLAQEGDDAAKKPKK